MAYLPARPAAARSSRIASVVVIALLAGCMVVGIAIRLVGLENNLYWRDEIATSLRLAGLTMPEIAALLGRDQERTPSEINALVFPTHPAPLSEVLGAVLQEEPHRSPVHYVLVFLHASLFGTSALSLRLLSIACSLLVLPAGYWLCRELFADRAVAVIGVFLLATSPFHVQYAREAREYSLWTATILASSAALLMALRRPSMRSWTIYALLNSLALLTSSLQVLVIGSHALFLLWRHRGRASVGAPWWPLPSDLPVFSGSLLCAGLTMLPWWVAGLEHRAAAREATEWMSAPVPWSMMLREWVKAFSRPFVGFAGEEWLYPIVPRAVGYALSAAALSLTGWSLVILWLRHERRSKAASFVSLLILVCLLAMLLPDLLFGGIRSIIGRYMAPVWVGFELAVAALLAAGCQSPARTGRLWTAGLAALLTVSATSSAMLVTHPGWGKVILHTSGDEGIQAARTINASTRPYVIVERMDRWEIRSGDTLALSRLLDEHVRVIVSDDPALALRLSAQGQVFLVEPGEAFTAALSGAGALEPDRPTGQLVRLRPP